MIELTKSKDVDSFKDFLKEVAPIRFKEPFAETLGAFTKKDAVVEYALTDVVKLAGHVCPTTVGAYLCCQKALKKLYPNEIPVRGDITITIHGEPHEGVYGVISQIFSFLTGAAPNTGFKGLGHKFRRKDLLKFSTKKSDPTALCFKFGRSDSDKTVFVKFFPGKIPYAEAKASRLRTLLEKVILETAKEEEKKEFQDLWMEKVKDMVLEKKQMNEWINIVSSNG